MKYRSLENDKVNVIRNLKPEEMKIYIKSLVNVLYESYLDGNEEKALASKRLIEEATSIYKKEGYENSLSIELGLRLDKANEVLIETLQAKEKQEIELSKVIVANAYDNDINKVISYINILEPILDSYEKAPSEELYSALENIVNVAESDLVGIKYLVEEVESEEDSIFSEDKAILEDHYFSFEKLVAKFKSLN